MVRGTPSSADSFLADFFGDSLIALSTSWHSVPLDCDMPALGNQELGKFGKVCIPVSRVLVLV